MSICYSFFLGWNCAMSGLHLRRISAAIMFLTISPMIASAQSGTSMIRGQALDSQSRAVPRARITVTEENNRLVRTETTGDLGEFAYVGLPPGTYRLDAVAAGFRKLVIEKVIAPVDSSIEVRVQFEVGEVSQTVTVSAAQEPLQNADAALGNTFESTRIEELPLNARNIISPALTGTRCHPLRRGEWRPARSGERHA